MAKKFRTEDELNKLVVSPKDSLRNAIKKLDNAHYGIILIAENNFLKGILTDSDIRKLVLKGEDLEKEVIAVSNTSPIVNMLSGNANDYKKIMIEKGLLQLPIVDTDNKIVDLVVESDFLRNGDRLVPDRKLNSKVVIMAGGKGTRLEPFTKILPKPLIPVGDKTILEWIMDEFGLYGMNTFNISVNHKSEMIKAYFNEISKKYDISYIKEDKPLGTAGSLKLLDGKLEDDFFVTNCDIIIKDKYDQIWDFHKKSKFDITIVASLRHHTIPYGVCELNGDGHLNKINEKPEYDFLINTGMYILNPEVLKIIPENKFYHITHLIEDAQKIGKNIGVFPIPESSWIDIGQWSEYKKTLNDLGL